MKHEIEPFYHGYNGGYDTVSYCVECDSQGLYEDLHPSNPCPFCGGNIRDNRLGIWIKPEYKTKFLFFKEKVKDGYWKIK